MYISESLNIIKNLNAINVSIAITNFVKSTLKLYV